MFVDTVKSAFSSLSANKQAIAKATALPILLSLMLDLVLNSAQGDVAPILVQILMALLSAIVAINVHSIILKGPQSVPQWGRFTFGKVVYRPLLGHDSGGGRSGCDFRDD